MSDKKEPLEIERKFLIRLPDEETLSRESVRTIEIEQLYLLPDAEFETRRLRRSVENGVERRIFTEKHRLADCVSIERERELTAEEWETLLSEADPDRRSIRKVRRCVPLGERMLEIDIFPFWQKQAYCEIELADAGEVFTLPAWVEVIREVTEDVAYSNRFLALSVPDED